MKIRGPRVWMALAPLALPALLCTLNTQTIFAQGSLAPPGPPAPVMKSLDQIEPRMPISSLPCSITNPGSYYLTTNVTGVSGTDGITVSAGGVTIDLNGFTMFGVPGSHSGVFISNNYTNITVRNGSLIGWGYSGVDALSASPSGVVLERLSVAGSGSYGLSAGNSIVRDCVCQNNGGGGLYITTPSVISGCSFIDNTNSYAAGLLAFGDCVARDCQFGFNYNGVVSFGGRCEIHDSQINSNSNDGAYIYFNIAATVTACASSFLGCSVVGNGQYGIYMAGGVNTAGSPGMVSDCLVAGNGQSGIYLNGCPGSKVSNCTVTGNGLSGIYIGGDGSKVVGNCCEANNSGSNTNNAGILIYANASLVEDNHLANNGYAGIAIKFGINSIVIKNTIEDGYIFASGNDIGPIGTAGSSSPWSNILR
jgi:parallel beta-helix repeat protein